MTIRLGYPMRNVLSPSRSGAALGIAAAEEPRQCGDITAIDEPAKQPDSPRGELE